MVPSQVAKLEERIAKIDTQLDKLRKQEQVEGYKEKVRHTVGHQGTWVELPTRILGGASSPSRTLEPLCQAELILLLIIRCLLKSVMLPERKSSHWRRNVDSWRVHWLDSVP